MIELLELKEEDNELMEEVVKLEEEAFGKNGGVDIWILKPLATYGRVYVLRENGVVVAVAEFMRGFNGESYLYGLATAKDYRKKGFATKIMKESFKKLKEKSLKTMYLTVDPKKEYIVDFYKKLGFTKDSYIENEYGEGIHRLKMRKEL